MVNLITDYKKYAKKKQNEKLCIFDLTTTENYNQIACLIGEILQINEPENKKWDFSTNKLQTRLLLAWFCMDKQTFVKTAEELGDDGLKFEKNIYLCGIKGSGKSSTIFALNEFICNFASKLPNSQNRRFKYVEQNKLANHFELNSNINKYTFNESTESNAKFEGSPQNIIFDDLKFDGLTKSFGTDIKDILIRFLYDRYSIWLFGEANTIITSLLTPRELKETLPTDLYSRFTHQYNVVNFKNEKRGK